MDILRISWDSTVHHCETLASMAAGFKPDMLIGLSRGGLVPVRILSDLLGIRQVAILGMEHYKDIGQKSEQLKITQDINIDLHGKKILVVDDVADSGKTLVAAKEHLLKKGAAEVKTATMHYKPISIFKPDYFVAITSAWIVYPWETKETERALKAKA